MRVKTGMKSGKITVNHNERKPGDGEGPDRHQFRIGQDRRQPQSVADHRSA